MSSPQPPQPPPAPRRSNNTVIALLVGIVVLLVLIVGAGLVAAGVILRNLHVHQAGNQVDVQSPLGNVSVNGGAGDLDRIGLPVYPGAERVSQDTDSAFDNGVDVNGGHMPGASVHLQAFGAGLDVNVVEFTTPASAASVLDFYQQKLGVYGPIVRHTESDGAVSLEVKHGDQHDSANVRAVAVRPKNGATHFVLVRVVAGSEAK